MSEQSIQAYRERVLAVAIRQIHTPRIERVTGTPFSVKCRHCGAWMGAGDGYETVADLNGEPWMAYFHADCAQFAGQYPARREGDNGFRHQTNG